MLKNKAYEKIQRSVKNDPEKYEKIKAKDNERKRKERQQQRQANQVDKALENELKRQKREQQRRFRAKQKETKRPRPKTPEKTDLMSKLAKMKQSSEKENAVLRTQMWRMNFKLQKNK